MKRPKIHTNLLAAFDRATKGRLDLPLQAAAAAIRKILEGSKFDEIDYPTACWLILTRHDLSETEEVSHDPRVGLRKTPGDSVPSNGRRVVRGTNSLA